jgi:hypothetical protein
MNSYMFFLMTLALGMATGFTAILVSIMLNDE